MIPPISDEIRDRIYCIFQNAYLDVRYDNQEIWPALDLLTPTVEEIFRQSVAEKPQGLTRSEVRSELAKLNFPTTELVVFVLLTYMECTLKKLNINEDTLDIHHLPHIRWQLI